MTHVELSSRLPRGMSTFVILSCLVLVLTATVNGLAGPVVSRTLLQALIFLLVVLGLYIFSGTSGVLSFGHIAFMAIGAYTSALLTIPPAQKAALFPDMPGALAWILEVELGLTVATLASGAVAAIFALMIAPALMRMAMIQAAIATLAVLVIVQVVLSEATAITRGTSTMLGVPQDVTLWTAAGWAIAAMLVAVLYQDSRHGLRLRATRENKDAARSVGISVARERGIAWVLSAFVVGVGGSLYAHYITTFAPDAFYFQLTFVVIVMLVVGGMTSITGAVIGVLLVSALSESLRRLPHDLPGLDSVILAGIVLVILIARPAGITGEREFAWPRRPRSRSIADAVPGSGK